MIYSWVFHMLDPRMGTKYVLEEYLPAVTSGSGDAVEALLTFCFILDFTDVTTASFFPQVHCMFMETQLREVLVSVFGIGENENTFTSFHLSLLTVSLIYMNIRSRKSTHYTFVPSFHQMQIERQSSGR